MGSLLKSTLNTRALPVGNLRYIRSDYPGKLTEQEVHWLLQNDITTIVDLREEKEYKARPCSLEEREGFTYYHLPVTGGGDTPASPDAVAGTYLSLCIGADIWFQLTLYAQERIRTVFISIDPVMAEFLGEIDRLLPDDQLLQSYQTEREMMREQNDLATPPDRLTYLSKAASRS